MIADDSPTLRRIVGTVLERAGYTVVTAEDGVEAVQAVFAHQPDAVILDVQMPRVSGYVAARAAQGRLADRGHPGPAADLARRRQSTATGARMPGPTAS